MVKFGLAEIMPYNSQSLYNATFFMSRKDLLDASIKHVIKREKRFGIVNQSKECINIDILKRDGD